MTEQGLAAIAGILILGIGSQWLAWRLRVPPILLLLGAGILAGPATGFLRPSALLGHLLVPVISASVALILFEGGLRLKFSELKSVGSAVRNLVTIGAFITWLISAVAANRVLGFPPGLAVLFGAILVVSGPTVIAPLIRHVRPNPRLSSVLRWEAILIDPLGAVLAVLVFEALSAGEIQQATTRAAVIFLRTVICGALVGATGAAAAIIPLRRYWIPDYLQNAAVLAAVLGVFTAANLLQRDSGLLAVTTMGIILANQKWAAVRHIMEFKENLSILLVSSLFILIGAQVRPTDIAIVGVRGLIFLAILILVARPAAVALATIRSELNGRERLYLACMCPRGVVCASVSAVFALRMSQAGHAQGAKLVPLAFMVVVGTVVVYGLAAAPMARALGLAIPNPQGLLIAGANPLAIAVGKALQSQGIMVLLVDTNRSSVQNARLAGLPSYFGSILSEDVTERIELEGIGRLLAMTSNDEVNALATIHFAEVFGRSGVYQLSPAHLEASRRQTVARHLSGRRLFGPELHFTALSDYLERGWIVRATRLSAEFDYSAYQARYDGAAIPLFLIAETGELSIFTTELFLTPRPGQTIIGLVDGEADAVTVDPASPGLNQ